MLDNCHRRTVENAAVHEPDAITLLAPVPRPPGIACFVTWKAHIEEDRSQGLRAEVAGAGERRSALTTRPILTPWLAQARRCGYRATPPRWTLNRDGGDRRPRRQGPDGRRKPSAPSPAIASSTMSASAKSRTRDGVRPGPDQGQGPRTPADILGPWLVTADEVGDPRGLRMSLHVNDEEWSAYDTAKMEWSFAELLVRCLGVETILPGQVGHLRVLPRQLRHGSGTLLETGRPRRAAPSTGSVA